jgi:hypothetical protein
MINIIMKKNSKLPKSLRLFMHIGCTCSCTHDNNLKPLGGKNTQIKSYFSMNVMLISNNKFNVILVHDNHISEIFNKMYQT